MAWALPSFGTCLKPTARVGMPWPVALAAGGELDKTASAPRLEAARPARQVSSRVGAQVAPPPDQKTIFGAVFFHPLARAGWERCAGEAAPTPRCARAHRNNNLGQRCPPRGFEWTMHDRSAPLATVAPADDPEWRPALPVPPRLPLLLADGQARRVSLIAAAGQKAAHAVKKVMNHYKGRYGTAGPPGGPGRGDETLWVTWTA